MIASIIGIIATLAMTYIAVIPRVEDNRDKRKKNWWKSLKPMGKRILFAGVLAVIFQIYSAYLNYNSIDSLKKNIKTIKNTTAPSLNIYPGMIALKRKTEKEFYLTPYDIINSGGRTATNILADISYISYEKDKAKMTHDRFSLIDICNGASLLPTVKCGNNDALSFKCNNEVTSSNPMAVFSMITWEDKILNEVDTSYNLVIWRGEEKDGLFLRPMQKEIRVKFEDYIIKHINSSYKPN